MELSLIFRLYQKILLRLDDDHLLSINLIQIALIAGSRKDFSHNPLFKYL